MDESIKDQDVLLVKGKEDNRLNVVSGIDKDGNIKTVPPTKEHEQDFMKIDKHSNVLENFFSNFLRQVKDPSHFGFFKVPAENVDAEAYILNDMLRDPNSPSNKEALDSVSVNPEEYAKKQSEGYKPLDESRIDWKQFEQMGVSRETLEKTNSLDAMLNYRKSPGLLPLNVQSGDTTIRIEARLSLRETEDGRIVPVTHTHRQAPDLEKSILGIALTSEDKANLLKTGNLGRIAQTSIDYTGKPIAVFVSIDKLTNELVAYRADRARIPDEIKGIKLDDRQKADLQQGKAIYLEGLTAKSGKSFNASVQYNADKRGLEFQFSENPKKAQQQQKEQAHEQKSENRELRIPKTLKGREISPEESDKLKAGQTVYMTGLKDALGKEFNAYVKPNFEKGKFDFLKWNPDKAKEIKPDNASQTQVAVNSEGKTNEATKDLKEPLKQGQTQPDEQQSKEQQKPKGLRM